MIRYMYAAALGLVSLAIPLRAVSRPHAGTVGPNAVIWTTTQPLTSLDFKVVGYFNEVQKIVSTPV
jgi:hypothetical protein